MAEKEFDPDDPFTLTGMIVALPKEASDRAEEEMASCFIEEYILMGYDDERILGLFRDPFFQATHAVFISRGEAYVRELLRRVSTEDGEPNVTQEESHG